MYDQLNLNISLGKKMTMRRKSINYVQEYSTQIKNKK